MLENTNPVIIPNELIVGQPDFEKFSSEESEEEEKYKKYLEDEKFMPLKRGRADHLAMDYQLLLDKGINGIIEILDEKIAALDLFDGDNTIRYEYYYCCRAELEGLLTLCEKYANKSRELAEISSGKEKKEYTELYNVLVQVPAKPARTFREAIQSIHMFTWSMYGIFSYGKPDVYLLPYYMNDIRK